MITKKICFIVVGKSAHINSWRGKKQRHLTADEVLGTKEGALVSRNGPKWAATGLFKTAGASGHKHTSGSFHTQDCNAAQTYWAAAIWGRAGVKSNSLSFSLFGARQTTASFFFLVSSLVTADRASSKIVPQHVTNNAAL